MKLFIKKCLNYITTHSTVGGRREEKRKLKKGKRKPSVTIFLALSAEHFLSSLNLNNVNLYRDLSDEVDFILSSSRRKTRIEYLRDNDVKRIELLKRQECRQNARMQADDRHNKRGNCAPCQLIAPKFVSPSCSCCLSLETSFEPGVIIN